MTWVRNLVNVTDKYVCSINYQINKICVHIILVNDSTYTKLEHVRLLNNNYSIMMHYNNSSPSEEVNKGIKLSKRYIIIFRFLGYFYLFLFSTERNLCFKSK